MIPREWEKDLVGLQFDGVMMHTSIDVNGCKVGEHHYGYSPFYVDLTDYVTFGEENRRRRWRSEMRRWRTIWWK